MTLRGRGAEGGLPNGQTDVRALRDAEGPGRQDLPIDRTREGEREGPERHERGHEARRARRGSVRRDGGGRPAGGDPRSEEHTSELHISYAVFCLKKKNKTIKTIE